MIKRKKIPFSREDLFKIFSYKDGVLFWRIKKGSVKPGDVAGSSTGHGYWRIMVDGVSYRRHRLIYYMHTGDQPDVIDHYDGDSTNDTFSNLKPSSYADNVRKGKKRSNNKSGVHGVSYDASRDKWRARIRIGNGKRLELGRFDKIEDAEEAYKKAYLKIQGESR